ncbi:MAG TPA: hypothetical protein VHX61_02040 [Rhizomicrobium sp.]|jgi:hypothetical protein|nr:hypothetical protein [Rhizomicrobium sp.]
MLKSVLLSTAALALIATAANARPQVTLSHDNRFVTTMPGKDQPLSTVQGKKKSTYLYTTL